MTVLYISTGEQEGHSETRYDFSLLLQLAARRRHNTKQYFIVDDSIKEVISFPWVLCIILIDTCCTLPAITLHYLQRFCCC